MRSGQEQIGEIDWKIERNWSFLGPNKRGNGQKSQLKRYQVGIVFPLAYREKDQIPISNRARRWNYTQIRKNPEENQRGTAFSAHKTHKSAEFGSEAPKHGFSQTTNQRRNPDQTPEMNPTATAQNTGIQFKERPRSQLGTNRRGFTDDRVESTPNSNRFDRWGQESAPNWGIGKAEGEKGKGGSFGGREQGGERRVGRSWGAEEPKGKIVEEPFIYLFVWKGVIVGCLCVDFRWHTTRFLMAQLLFSLSQVLTTCILPGRHAGVVV